MRVFGKKGAKIKHLRAGGRFLWGGVAAVLRSFSAKKQTPDECRGFVCWRRKRDLNPRDTFAPYSLSRGAPSPLGYFSIVFSCLHHRKWRREWDSNPRMLAHRRFSRPVPSTARPSLHNAPTYFIILLSICQLIHLNMPRHCRNMKLSRF